MERIANSNSLVYVGVNDHEVDLFEGQYTVPNGMAYNSYLILDEKIAVLDTVDAFFTDEWLHNIHAALNGKTPSYLIVQHMEPDHSAGITAFLKAYPEAAVVASAKAFTMMQNFYGLTLNERQITVTEGSTLSLGAKTLTFIAAPMVHWPEVLFTYDADEETLFSADAFGKFGALDVKEDWDCEARRYYFGIVGKFGPQVQSVLKKAAALKIKRICPLHGPVLQGDLSHYLAQYNTWSSYQAETNGVFIAYTSVYGNTKKAAELLAKELKAAGCPKVAITDLAREDMAEAVEDAFRYSKLVLATTTYNAGIFPFMREFIEHLTERGYQNRTVAFIENGSWAPTAAKAMQGMLAGCKNLTLLPGAVKILSALSEENKAQLKNLAAELCRE